MINGLKKHLSHALDSWNRIPWIREAVDQIRLSWLWFHFVKTSTDFSKNVVRQVDGFKLSVLCCHDLTSEFGVRHVVGCFPLDSFKVTALLVSPSSQLWCKNREVLVNL